MRTGIWFVTHYCNLKCPYCWQNGEYRSLVTDENEMFSSATDWVAKATEALKILNLDLIDFTGGEPLSRPIDTLMPHFPGLRFAVTTNTTFFNRLLSLAALGPDRFVSCTLSYHPTQREGGQIKQDRFWEAVLELRRARIPTTVNFVGHPSQLFMTGEVEEMCKKHGVRFHFDPYSVAPWHKEPVYNETQRMIIQKYSTDPNRQRPTTMESGTCTAGKQHFMLDPCLNLFRCLRDSNDPTMQIANLVRDSVDTVKARIAEFTTACSYVHACAGCDRDKVTVTDRQQIG